MSDRLYREFTCDVCHRKESVGVGGEDDPTFYPTGWRLLNADDMCGKCVSEFEAWKKAQGRNRMMGVSE